MPGPVFSASGRPVKRDHSPFGLGEVAGFTFKQNGLEQTVPAPDAQRGGFAAIADYLLPLRHVPYSTHDPGYDLARENSSIFSLILILRRGFVSLVMRAATVGSIVLLSFSPIPLLF